MKHLTPLPDKMILRPSRRRNLLWAVGCAAGLVFTTIDPFPGIADDKTAIAQVIFAILTPLAILKALFNPGGMALTDGEFAYRDLGKIHAFQWRDVEVFEIGGPTGAKGVSFRTSSDQVHTLPDTYGMSATRLRDLLADFKNRSVGIG